jgi:DNA helicase-2/ATP-dependent DNA helicase PcrA
VNPPESWLESLNPAQRAAVVHAGGPLLVLAGAGSGKTRVITHRIAWLVREAGVPPGGIVAVTFTNRAATEMRTRVERLLGLGLGGPWIGTFQAVSRMLRRDEERVGRPNFAIYDRDDQVALLRRLLDDGVDDRLLGPGVPRADQPGEEHNGDAPSRRRPTPRRWLVARIYALQHD